MGLFSKIPLKFPRRTKFNLGYSTKFSLDFGQLVPIMCEKIVPGDKAIHSHEFFMRFAPFANQVFQGFQVRTEYFFVPTRLLWKNFEMWLSKGMLGESSYAHPFINYKYILRTYASNGVSNVNSIFDYFNLPTLWINSGTPNIDTANLNSDLPIDALPFFAYLKIFLDYYADENLEYSSLIEQIETNNSLLNVPDGNAVNLLSQLYGTINNSTSSVPLRKFKPFKRSYPKDYFTSALPFAQRGPVVQIPIHGGGEVTVYSEGAQTTRYKGVYFVQDPNTRQGTLRIGKQDLDRFNDAGNNTCILGPAGGSNVTDAQNALNDTDQILHLDMSNITQQGTITDLRTAIAIQEFLEKRARAGSRAKEQIYASFGVESKDYRLDRSEFLQSTCNYVNIGEVYTATANEASTDIPGMAVSTAKAANTSKVFKKFFEEHGYLIGIMSVFPTATYYQGIPRQFMELDQYDYYWPEFQHIGEQDVKKQELYLDTVGDTEGVFGYQPRYSQYKSRLNQVHGEFRNNLKFMTCAREFAAAPALNNQFVQIDPDYNNLHKVFRTQTPFDNSNPVYVDLYHHLNMIRPMNYYGIPRFI